MTLEDREEIHLLSECLAKQSKSKFWRLVNYNRGIRYKFVSGNVLDTHYISSPMASHPAAPKIIWIGEAAVRFRRRPPPPGYSVADRVYEIALCFMPPPDRVEEEDDEYELLWKEELLDELLAYDILYPDVADVTTELHSKGCLFSFLDHLFSNKHACIRAKAPEVITTMVQSNLTNQKLVIEEANGLQLLLHNFTTYLDDSTSRIRILVAISALIEGNEYGVVAFGRENGYAALIDALISENVANPMSALYSKLLILTECFVRETNLYDQVPDLEVADASEVHEFALSILHLLAEREGGNSGQLVKKDETGASLASKKMKPEQVLLQDLPSAALHCKLENEAPWILGLGPPTVPRN